MRKTYQSLGFYSFLSQLPHPKSYKGKIMLVAFLGTHVPLLSLLLHFLVSNSFSLDKTLRVLAIALVATLVGTGITLYVLHKLLAPVLLTSSALRKYFTQKQLPSLPTQYTDEVGSLMADTVQTLNKLDQVIEHLTNYDNLTGLPNRVLFTDRLQQALSNAEGKNRLLGVICLHLPNFREINNALGSGISNQLLRIVTQKLTAHVGRTDLLCHLSSNEFAIALPDLTTSEEAIPFCQSLLSEFASPITIQGNQLHIQANLGIAVYPFDGDNIEQLLQNADTAVDEAKRRTVNSYQFFGTEMNAQLQERLILETQLRYALERNELQLHYQPRVDANSGKILGVEALIRWQNPELGFVSPVKFIPIAEANGLIIPIGEWVLRTACNQNRLWKEAGLPPLRVAVNLSARQLAQPNLVDLVAQILAETNLCVADLELEVTESLIMENVEHSINVLQQLHEMGITLALDDFGTGFSSLNYLRRFPIDILKIDRSFVNNVVVNQEDAAVTNTIINLAKDLHLHITAEGVETKEQFEYLKIKGCDEIQGYYFSKPLPSSAITELLYKNHESLQQKTIAA
jgi:diguanylate cyclase (GGDEF)-like protein